MVFAGYMGSVAVVTTVKWFWFTFSLVALVFVLFSIARTFKDAAVVRGGAIASLYGQLAALILISWIFYPVICVVLLRGIIANMISKGQLFARMLIFLHSSCMEHSFSLFWWHSCTVSIH